jgi:ABC-type transport system involved in multi-copper enzyme maturation permease subunit
VNRLWLHQIRGMLRLELRKNLLSLRALPLYLLAAMPVGVVLLMVLVSSFTGPPPNLQDFAGTAEFYANLYQFILRAAVFLGCVWVFMNLFRGELLDRSLHYYFLCPVRREVLVAGKYVSAWISSTALFSISTAFTFLVVYSFAGETTSLLAGPARGHLLAYLGTTALACLGYGSVFLFIGLFFRNPLVPAFVILVWEGANFLLPGLLKKISVIFYLQSLFPVTIPEGPFAVIVQPVSPWLGAPGLVLFTAAVLVLAGRRIRRMEIAYTAD